jgi:HEPN domain
MSVSPRDLLREARKVAERADEETARRTAASKAYYAAYHGAKGYHDLLPKPGRSKQNVGDHENLIHSLRYPDQTLGDAICKHSIKIGELLLRLRPSRVRADYDLQAEVTVSDMNDAIEMAVKILNLANPTKP